VTALRIVLCPFSLLYGIITFVRNKLYDWGWIPSVRFDGLTVIGIGNITVGGTGKTPHVEYFVRMLSPHYGVAVLSRGYRRKSKGFVVAGADSTALDVGDEPCQIKRKFPHLTVAVDTDRVAGIRKLKALYPEIRIILLDDAFQHRKVTPSLSVLLADYHRPLYRDGMLPGGRLREWKCFARRADMLIVTKTPPELSEAERQTIRSRYARFFPKDIYFTGIAYGSPQPVFRDAPPAAPDTFLQSSVLLVTGIAAPKPLENHVRTIAANVCSLTFPDHHRYTPADMQHIMQRLQQLPAADKFIFTTEKDAARLRLTNIPEEIKKYVFYIRIEINFIGEKPPIVHCHNASPIIEH
jgi:tetraacyldisaccharide 4'-kinase